MTKTVKNSNPHKLSYMKKAKLRFDNGKGIKQSIHVWLNTRNSFYYHIKLHPTKGWQWGRLEEV